MLRFMISCGDFLSNRINTFTKRLGMLYICNPKGVGGLGFKIFYDFKRAVKLGWLVQKNADVL